MDKMGLWDTLKKSLQNGITIAPEKRTVSLVQLADFLGLEGVPKSKLSEATYFACLKILSESLGKLPLKLQKAGHKNGVREAADHPMYNILRYRPNPYMTSTTFWSTVEYNRNHYGNAYCLISGAGKQLRLWILPSSEVEIWYDDASILSDIPNIWYIYTHGGKSYKFGTEEILHFKTSSSIDGIKGLAVRDILESTINGSLKAQNMLNKLYDNGFSGKLVAQYTGNLNDKSMREFGRYIEDYARGKGKLGKENVIPIPVGSTLQPLNVKLSDAEFLVNKKYSALQVAAAFGIKPNQINDYEKASYASAEAQQLAFYVDTLLYILKQYEEELTSKLLSDEERADGYRFKFNVSVILRADLKTQIESLVSAVSNFIYTPNEARALLDLESRENGDTLIGNGTTIPIDMVGMQYQKKEGNQTDGRKGDHL